MDVFGGKTKQYRKPLTKLRGNKVYEVGLSSPQLSVSLTVDAIFAALRKFFNSEQIFLY